MADDSDMSHGPDLAFIGDGELPAEFDKVNWGAFGFAPIWALLYGPWPWLAAFVTAIFGPILIDNIVILFFDSRDLYQAVRPITSTAMAVTLPVLAALYSVFVNKAVWERERRKMAANPEAHRPLLVDRYRKSVRFWTRLFVGLLALNWGLSVALLLSGHLGSRDAILPGIGDAALLVLFVYDRVRAARRAGAQIASP